MRKADDEPRICTRLFPIKLKIHHYKVQIHKNFLSCVCSKLKPAESLREGDIRGHSVIAVSFHILNF